MFFLSLHLWALSINILSSVDISGNYFCHLACGHTHTACRRAPCATNSKICGRSARSLQFREEDRAFIVEELNLLRNLTLLGDRGSTNMQAISYSTELEFVAQCWSNGCIIGHDSCNSLKDYETVGQNIYYHEDIDEDDDPEDTKFFAKTLKDWYSEKKYVSSSLEKSYRYDDRYANYSQLLWASTLFIGCGRTEFWGGIFIVCNFVPEGNVENVKMYDVGEPCTKCGNVKCNKRFQGLCGDSSVEDVWLPPFPMLKASRRYSNLGLLTLSLWAVV